MCGSTGDGKTSMNCYGISHIVCVEWIPKTGLMRISGGCFSSCPDSQNSLKASLELVWLLALSGLRLAVMVKNTQRGKLSLFSVCAGLCPWLSCCQLIHPLKSVFVPTAVP